ncbi:GNAT family N-acetyltransferase [Francisella adeliensis]|nr:GNAT family N-acetyltransferase [Francisella adeliensis]MBK2084746.1 GNAT family N-acetyltransferase [Francisella adeliensis]MBK2097311.1 GNAT family N-acetyltransferase [Francisella adeliensis]
MKLPQSSRLTYRLISRSEEDRKLLETLDTNPINREFFPNGALDKHQIPTMVERFVGGYGKYQTPVFLVFDKQENFIGRAGFAYTEELDVVEMGYVLDYKFWGKGYATEIANTLLEWARSSLEYKEVFAFTGVDHIASITIMKKTGMEYVETRTLKGIECVLYKKNL